MKFLGTAAADGLPGPFCACRTCQDARRRPERQRMRSMFMLDEKTLIDFGPDLCAACARQGLDMSALDTVFITHTHEDHFCPSNAGLIHMSKTRGDKPVDVYLSEAAYKVVYRMRDAFGDAFTYMDAIKNLDQGLVRLHPVKIGVPFERSGYQVLAVGTTHQVSPMEAGVNYLFEKAGFKLLYACDTGYYPEETIELLRGCMTDALVLESTWGNMTEKSTASHMNCMSFLHMLDISPARFDDPLRLPALLQAQFLPEYEDRIRQLMKRLAQMGKGLELNTGGRGIPWAASARNVGPWISSGNAAEPACPRQ